VLNWASRRQNYASVVSPLAQRLRRISRLEKGEEAYAFLRLYHQEAGKPSAALQKRWGEVQYNLKKRGSYWHTEEELAFGARVAWRNHGRCIGRLFWDSLEVVDCRGMGSPEQIIARMSAHMREANRGNCGRPIISIFEPVSECGIPSYVESAQIAQYAGHLKEDGSVIEDRQNVETTRISVSLGYRVPEPISHFDLLPVLLRDKTNRRLQSSLPADCVREVNICHPNFERFRELGLKWYAVPCVSGMILTIGGIDYPCAPFSGFYLATEIGSRDFADKKRYDLLPKIAECMELSAEDRETPLWRDRALTELNIAVLSSFKEAGVAILDHHTASNQYMEFHGREQAQGRRVPGDWRWIVPPQASAACDVFHLRMKNFHPVPNYYHSRADDGSRLMPYYGDLHRNRFGAGYDRVIRRWKIWKRAAW
jgi:nitric-oxide synthase, bacterial